jgi:hypothetical protein
MIEFTHEHDRAVAASATILREAMVGVISPLVVRGFSRRDTQARLGDTASRTINEA